VRVKTAVLVSLGCCIAGSGSALAAVLIAPSSLVAQPAELPGFASAKVTLHSATTPSRYAKVVLEERPRAAAKEVVKLKRKGFQEGVQETLSSHRGEALGLSLALVFGSARVAEQELKTGRSESVKAQGKAKITRFTVPAIPGSFGFSATEAGHSGGAANVLFSSGRCFFLVGDTLRKGSLKEVASAPIAGATAVYQRVKSLCV
jgi:hypothetical protein